MTVDASALPAWAEWPPEAAERPYSVGVEEEVMLLEPDEFALAPEIERIMPRLPPGLAHHATEETHGSVLELATDVHADVDSAAAQLLELRRALREELGKHGLVAGSAGTHPFAVWQDTVVSSAKRYQLVYGSMRELARREPTFALHVHVGIPGHEEAIRVVNRMRCHLPLLLALSVNSPFWQGRDTGLASARTPLFQAFPRVGIPRAFADYAEYAETVDLLVRCDAFPEPTFLWWDIRPQARFGTVEVRIMDAQTTVDEAAALVALVQSIARLELEEGHAPEQLVQSAEVLDENRFLAARDGMDARLVDPVAERRVPVRDQLEELLRACEPHAAELGCGERLAHVRELAESTGAVRQLAEARAGDRLVGLMASVADAFCLAGTDDGRPARLGLG